MGAGHLWQLRPITPNIRPRTGASPACPPDLWRIFLEPAGFTLSWITRQHSAMVFTPILSTAPRIGSRRSIGREYWRGCIFIIRWRTAEPSAGKWQHRSLGITFDGGTTKLEAKSRN